MNKISSESFHSILEKFHDNLSSEEPQSLCDFNDCQFTEGLTIRWTPENLAFTNCHFEEVTFKNHSNAEAITFKDCTIKSIKFVQIEIKIHLLFNSTIISDFASIHDCTINRLYLTKVKINKGNLRLSEFKTSFIDVKDAWIKSGISFNKSDIKGTSRFINLQAPSGSLSFTDSTFHKKTFFIGGQLLKGVIFNDSSFYESIRFDYVNMGSSLSVIRTSFKNSLKLIFSSYQEGNIEYKNSSLPESIYLQNSEFGDEFVFDGKQKSEKDSNGSLKKVTIVASNMLKGNIYISNTNTNYLSLSGSNHNANLIFNGINANQINISNFSNHSNLQFQRIKAIGENSKFELTYSNLDNTSLYNVDLASFKSLEITDSQITNILASNVEWPSLISTQDFENEDPSMKHKRLREVYRQLKHALKSQGGNIQALEFGKLEMQSYREELKPTSKYGEKIILWTNQSNDYGQNWLKPLFWLLYINFLFFMFIVTHGEFKFDYSLDFWEDSKRLYNHLWNVKGKYFYLLNPTHNIRHLYPVTWSTTSVLMWDTLSRIVNGYFIFQMISAFRKYLKK